MRHAVVAAVLAVAASMGGLAQAPTPSPGPAFDVVSIRRNTGGTFNSDVNERPDGGFTMTNVSVSTLIRRAYPTQTVPADWVGLPDWASRETFDVSATSSLPAATADERAAMMRALLVERFGFAARIEQREQEVYELVRMRKDGALGPGLKRDAEDVDCEARAAAQRAAAEAARAAGQPPPPPFAPSRAELNGTPPPCTIFTRALTAHRWKAASHWRALSPTCGARPVVRCLTGPVSPASTTSR